MVINENFYDENLWRVNVDRGFAWSVTFDVYALNEQEAVDLVADYIEEHKYSDLYCTADTIEYYSNGETVEAIADSQNLTCCGNHGIYIRINDITKI